jgi:hypothetical protein
LPSRKPRTGVGKRIKADMIHLIVESSLEFFEFPCIYQKPIIYNGSCPAKEEPTRDARSRYSTWRHTVSANTDVTFLFSNLQPANIGMAEETEM